MKTNKQTQDEQFQSSVISQSNSVHQSDISLQLTPLDLHRAIRLPEVLYMTGLSRSSWYALLNPRLPAFDKHAPRPFKLGNSERSPSAWWVWQVLAYLQSKSNARSVH